MKILNLYFKNINSLAGENRVNFDQAPLADAGVFAITGPNGSGKTSILDAITLGLYGETFKFDRPAAHVMTQYSNECFAQVVFSVAGTQYRSSWSVNRQQDGSVQPAQMQLHELNGEETVLADRPNQVKTKIAELTGMDFRSFTRSIMLAQGDFSAFLNALDNERLDILEKIISTDVYADFKKQILDRAEQEKNKVQAIEAQIAQFADFDDAEMEAAEQDLADFREQQLELKQRRAGLQRQLDWLKNIEDIDRRIDSFQKRQQQAGANLQQTQRDLQRIEANKDLLKYQPDLQAIDDKDTEIKQQQKNLHGMRNEVAHLRAQLHELGAEAIKVLPQGSKSLEQQQQSIERLQQQLQQLKVDKQSERTRLQGLQMQLQGKQENYEHVAAWLQEHQSEQFLLDEFPEIGRLKSLRAEFKSLQGRQKSYEKWSKSTTSSLTKNKIEYQKLERKIASAEQKLQEYRDELSDITHGYSAEYIDELRATQEERLVLFKDLLALARAHKKLESSGLLHTLRIKAELDSDMIKTELAKLDEQISREKNILRTLEKAVADETLLKRYQVERVLLVDGEPCPLCGALHHPYVDKPPVLKNSAKALADQQKKLQDLQAGHDKLQQRLQLALQQEQKNDQKDTELVQVRSQWVKTSNRLNVSRDDLNIGNIRLMKKLLEKEADDLKVIKKMQKNYLRQKNRIEKQINLIKSREDLRRQLHKSIQKLDREWNERPQELKDLEQKTADCEAELTQLTERLKQQLAVLDIKLPGRGKEDVLYDKLNRRRQEYQTYHIRGKNLMTDIEGIEEKITQCREGIEQMEKTIQQYTDTIKNEEITALQFILLEKQKDIARQEGKIKPLQDQKEALQRDLQNKLAATAFESLSELRNILALILKKDQLQQRQTGLLTEIEHLSREQNKARTQKEAEIARAVTELSPQELNAKLHAVLEKLDITRHEINRLEKTKREYKTWQMERQKLLEQLQQQQARYQECAREVQQIEAEQSIVFRRKVQKAMADKLLSIANTYLEKISGRYYLHQRENQQGLALEIEDTYKDNARRLPKTLSGGESFVVSLALALALSELASNGCSLDSLFLDEGFGNLDEEALYVVVSTLKSLRQQGKSVGVISHIKGVKERISTQIEMSRNPNGTSGFAVVS